MRCIRPLFALVFAYALLLAAVLGAVAAGQSAALDRTVYCRIANDAGDQAPARPLDHGLDCCIACAASSSAALGVSTLVLPAFVRATWIAIPTCATRSSRPQTARARAPPLSV